MSDDIEKTPKKSGPLAISRNDTTTPRALRPVSGAENWGAAPMPPAESPSRRVGAIAAVCGAALATAATLALYVASPSQGPEKLSNSDAADWASRMKRLVPKVQIQDDDTRQHRTAGIAPRPRINPPPHVQKPSEPTKL